MVFYLLIMGDTFSAMGILGFGLLSSSLDNFLRPMIVSKRTQIHSSIILIGLKNVTSVLGEPKEATSPTNKTQTTLSPAIPIINLVNGLIILPRLYHR